MKTRIIATLLLCSFIAFGASAQTIRGKAANQRARIKQGVKSGELTKAEAVNLAKDQKEIRNDIKDAKKDDGVIDRSERKEIKQEQRKESRKIYRKKHNLRDRN